MYAISLTLYQTYWFKLRYMNRLQVESINFNITLLLIYVLNTVIHKKNNLNYIVFIIAGQFSVA